MEIARQKNLKVQTYSLVSLFGYDDEENQGDKNKKKRGFFKEHDMLPVELAKFYNVNLAA